MAYKISPEELDNIKRNASIVDVVGSYVSLIKSGKSYKCLCPFHNDTNPSMTLKLDAQIYTCWSCGASGNVFTFVQNIEKVSFTEAVKKVCEICKLPVPDGAKIIKPVVENKYARLNRLLNDLTKYYMLQLNTEDGKEGKKYLDSRNLNNEDIKTFKIGYAPSDGIKQIEYLRSKGYTDDELISAGICSDKSNGSLVDKFRGRVVFSLCDANGNVVGFSGRRIIDDDSAKYVNSPETVLFKKTGILYNYKNALEKSKNNCTYVVEGFMDAIALHKSGVESVVATMGTAFTTDHVKLLEGLHNEIRLFFDADDPGQEAIYKSLQVLKKAHCRAKIKVVKPLDVNKAKDIDEVLNKYGKEEVLRLVELVKEPLEWYFEHLARKTNFNNYDENKQFVDQALTALVNSNTNEFDKEHYLEIIKNYSRFSLMILNDEYKKKALQLDKQTISSYQDHSYNEVSKILTKYEQAEHQILKMMISEPLTIQSYKMMNISFPDKDCRKLAALIISVFNQGRAITYSNLFDQADAETAKLLGIIERENYPENDLNKLANILGEEFTNKQSEIDERNKISLEEDKNKQLKMLKEYYEKKKEKLNNKAKDKEL